MHRLARILAVALAVAPLACKEKPAPPQPVAPQRPAAGAFTLRDLALATALDARLARLSLAASDVEAAFGAAAARRDAARRLLAPVEIASAEVRQAAAAVANPLNRPLASRAAALAASYAERIAAAVRASGAPPLAEVAAARDALGGAIAAYRQARSRWRLDAPEPEGAERELAESRRELERAETGLMARPRSAPREEGRELEPAALRRSAGAAVERARTAAARLPPALKDAAARYAAAQEKVLAAATALPDAADGEKARAARAYHAAKVEALAALADYFAALAAR